MVIINFYILGNLIQGIYIIFSLSLSPLTFELFSLIFPHKDELFLWPNSSNHVPNDIPGGETLEVFGHAIPVILIIKIASSNHFSSCTLLSHLALPLLHPLPSLYPLCFEARPSSQRFSLLCLATAN